MSNNPTPSSSPLIDRLKRIAALLMAAVLPLGIIVVFTGLTALPAQAASTVQPEILGSNWLQGHGVNVCYPVGASCSGTTAFPEEGANNWQCEELAARLWTALGWYSAGWTYYAKDLYGGLNAAQVTYHPNNGTYVPVPGDLIVHRANDGFALSAGHVAIVDSVDAGSLTIHAVEENVSPRYESSPGRATYVHGPGGWTRQGFSASPVGFVHANANHGFGPTGHAIYNQAHGLCLDAAAQTLSVNGGIVQLWTCVGDTNQNWYRVGNEIVNQANGKCLDANWGTDGNDGGLVQMWSCNNGPNQQWVLDGSYRYVNRAHGLCLDANWSTDGGNGGKVQLWQCNTGPNQQWKGTGPHAVYGPYQVQVGTGATLHVRTGPGTTYPLAAPDMANGASFYLYCQTPGTTVNGNSYWDLLTTGGYIADGLTNTPGVGPPSSGLPTC